MPASSSVVCSTILILKCEPRRLLACGIAPTRLIEVLIEKVGGDPNLDVRTRSISALGHYIYEKEMAGMEENWTTRKKRLANST